MARKQQTLPRDFLTLLERGDLSQLKSVFDRCEIDARDRDTKRTALAFDLCPDALTRWLVSRGADLGATDTWGNTPLHVRAGTRRGQIDVLLELGADVHASRASIGTPLHAAASSKNVINAAKLLARGARVDAKDREGLTPLEVALQGCTNADLEPMLELAKVLLDAGASRTPAARGYVETIGKRFEFMRARIHPEWVERLSRALNGLYALFEVAPVPTRTMHDGRSPIRTTARTWQAQHQELWSLLVPPTGPAATVQGEVIRISGRIGHELLDNGGLNWGPEFRKMGRAFLAHLRSGNALSAPELARARAIVEGLRVDTDADVDGMAELAVSWVLGNPDPIQLEPPDDSL
jgi:hypothetical protein